MCFRIHNNDIFNTNINIKNKKTTNQVGNKIPT